MKTKTWTLILLIFLVAGFKTVNALSFPDVSNTNPHIKAIDYLSDIGILSGYADQTFKPYQLVNRAEFLKIVLEASQIQSNEITPTDFPDVNNNAWYAKYVRKAFHEGWIEGYPDGTFKPENTINQVEALKIIGEVQNWQTTTSFERPFLDVPFTAWFAPYVTYAKDKNFLFTRTSNFIPEAKLNRAQISEILFRTFITNLSDQDFFDDSLISEYPADSIEFEKNETPEVEEEPETNMDFIPVTSTTISADFFDAGTLSDTFPNTFYQNEIYNFTGTTNSTAELFVIFLAPENVTNPEKYINYYGIQKNGFFEIPVYFDKPGNYKMGLISGLSGKSKIVNISVLAESPVPETVTKAPAPKSVNINFKNDQTRINWQNDSLYTKITLQQGSEKIEYLSRQKNGEFFIDYNTYENFSEGTAKLIAQGGTSNNSWSEYLEKSFIATQHLKKEIDSNGVTLNNYEESISTNESVVFSGTTLTDIYADVAIIDPQGLVTYDIISNGTTTDTNTGSKIISKGSNFTYTFNPPTRGNFIIEINKTEGSAAVNVPIYVDSGIPLLPDYFDLNRLAEPNENFSLNISISEALSLINKERKLYDLTPVILDDQLSELAQLHAEDMSENNYLDHINMDGQTPDDRRKELGIDVQVSENIAIAPTLEYAHEGLMRSAIHRENVLNPKWTRVGIGLAQGTDNEIIIVQEFAEDSFNSRTLQDLENNILAAINNERTENDINIFTRDPDLETIADEWSQLMVDQDFFDFTSPNGTSLVNLIQNTVNKEVQALLLGSAFEETITEQALQADELLNSKWTRLGIGIKADNEGSLKVTLLFTTH